MTACYRAFLLKDMTPKEKATKLVNKFVTKSVFDMDDNEFIQEKLKAKNAALICADEIIKEHCHDSEHKDPIAQDKWIEFWQQVKVEINDL